MSSDDGLEVQRANELSSVLVLKWDKLLPIQIIAWLKFETLGLKVELREIGMNFNYVRLKVK